METRTRSQMWGECPTCMRRVWTRPRPTCLACRAPRLSAPSPCPRRRCSTPMGLQCSQLAVRHSQPLKRSPRMFLCAVPDVCLRPGGRDRHSARRPREPALRPPCAHGLYGQPHLRSGRGEGGTCGALRPPSILFAPVRLPVQRVKGRGRACRGEAGGRGGERRRDGGGEGLTHYRALAAAYRRPAGHGFFVAKLKLTGLWLIDRYGGAATISPTDYFSAAGTAAALPAVSKPAPAALSAVSAAAAAVSAAVVAAAAAVAAPAPVPRGETAEAPPWFSDKAATARWMVQNLQVHLTLTLTLTLTPTLTPTPTPTQPQPQPNPNPNPKPKPKP